MHISNNYTPYSGGVVSSLNALLPALEQSGNIVTLITLDFNQKTNNDPVWVQRIPSLWTGFYKENKVAIPSKPKRFIERAIVAFNPSIIHVHHPFLLGAIGKKLAIQYGIPCVFTYHTMYEQYSHYLPGPTSMIKYCIQKKVLSFCRDVDAIITPSSGIKKTLEKHAIKTPLQVIPSPIQNHFFEPINSSYKKDANDTLKLLYVGRFREEKNVAALLDLFAMLDKSKYHLTLVGYGDQEGILRQKAYEHYRFTEHQVQFVIMPEIHELRRLYDQSDLFLFPSQTDTQGLVLIESMAHGTPVIALPGFGQEDSVINGYNGFIVSDIHVMREYIEFLYNNTVKFRQISENALKTAQCFSQKNIVFLLLEFYKGISLKHSQCSI